MNETKLPVESKTKELAPVQKSNFIAGGIFHLIDRLFDGIASVYGDMRPAIEKSAGFLGRTLEEKERKIILKRPYSESEENIFFSFLTDLTKGYSIQCEKIRAEIRRLQAEISKCKIKSLKNARKQFKVKMKNAKIARNTVSDEQAQTMMAEAEDYYKEYSELKILESQLKQKENENKILEENFLYVCNALIKKNRKLPDVVARISKMEHGALTTGFKFKSQVAE